MTLRLIALIILIFVVIVQVNKYIKSNDYEHLNDLKKVSVEVQDGDIIFRQRADDVIDKSFSVDNLNYSQVGIILHDKQNNIYVFYIKSDEKNSFLQVESMEDFAKASKKIGVYKYFKDIDKKLLVSILEFYKNNHYLLYNTEFINEVFYKMYSENLYTNLQNVDGKEVITVKSILENSKLKKRYEIEF